MSENEKQEELLVDEEQTNKEDEMNAENEKAEEVVGDQEETNQESLETELDKVKQEKQEIYEKLLRVQADFENSRRRLKKEKENDLKYKSQEVVTELLPVVDNFDRALRVEVENESMKSFVDGMNMIYRQLTQALENAGVKEIEAEGETFDPHLHQAVMQDTDENYEPNTVIEVLQKGYILKDRVIRPAMVKVNQ